MTAPGRDCPNCPRLAVFREELRIANPHWYNAPVPSFGPLDAQLLIVGLAPGMKGANRTGRPFTGDYAGDLLYKTLADFGFSSGAYDARPDDGLALLNCRITNAVRCLPPENKPTGAEEKACRPFLADEIAAMARLRIILVLGTLANGAVSAALAGKKNAFPFAHGAWHHPAAGPALVNSYHCSRYNTNTGRLSEAMFRQVFAEIRRELDG